MRGWTEIQLEDALEVLIDYRGKSPKKSETGIPVISAKVVKSGRILDGIEQTIAPDYYLEWMRRGVPQAGDVVMTTEGPLGEVARLDETSAQYALGQRIVTMRGREGVLDNGFLKYLLMSSGIQERLQSRATGSTVAGISQKSLRSLPLPLAPFAEQREIASILGALDDKIELNRRMSATLEDMARSLYRSWFVDFDPVNAKMEGRQPAFMDEATSALFPDRFGGDGLPEGWMRQSIGNHFVAHKGLSYKGSGLCNEDEGLPLHNLNSVLEGGGYKYSGIKYYSEDYRERHTVRPGDLIVANTEQGFDHMLIGHSAIVPRNFGPMGLFSHHLFKVEPKSRSWLSREWLYLTLSVSPTGTVVRSFSNGTTVNMLPADAFEIPQIIVPAEAVVDRFNDLISPWFDRRDEAINQASTLAALRDSLLPKLMSGELRVGEAREQVEEVA